MRGLMTAVSGIDGGSGRAAARSFAIVQRRKSRREEWETHVRLASLMQRYIDPSCVFWSSLENAPRSMLGGLFARRRNVRAGLPDLMVIARGLPPVFVELKSSRGVASAAQKKIRTELVAAGCSWFLVRSSRAGLAALFYAGIPFKRRWQPPKRLRPWEGPFLGTEKRLPQHPRVASERRAARQRWRLRQRARAAQRAGTARHEGAQPPDGSAPAAALNTAS
jgi:hypothetical protein